MSTVTQRQLKAWLAEWRDAEEDKEKSHRYTLYNKAYKEVCKLAPASIFPLDEILAIKQIGPSIKAKVEKRIRQEAEMSSPESSDGEKGKGKSKKRAAQNEHHQSSPPKRTKSGISSNSPTEDPPLLTHTASHASSSSSRSFHLSQPTMGSQIDWKSLGLSDEEIARGKGRG